MPTDGPKAAPSSPSATSAKASTLPAGPVRTLPKGRRLLKRAQFLNVYEKGKRISGRLFVAIFLRRDRGEARVGLTVSKRVGNAVVRNRAKRLIREAVRHNWEAFPAPCDAVIQARSGVREATAEQVESELLRAIERFRGAR